MGKLVVSINLTLDGVIEDPMGDGELKAGGWAAEMPDQDRTEWARHLTEEAFAASGLLFGARTYAWFVERWTTREGGWADRLRELPKYVVSSTDPATGWGPVTRIDTDAAGRVQALKDEAAGDLLVFGSGQLLPVLFDNDLVDELRLFVFPTIAGSGRRLFDQLAAPHQLRLVSGAAVGAALVRQVYEFDRD